MSSSRKLVVLAFACLFYGGCAEVEHSAGGVFDNGASVIREVGRQPWYVEDSTTGKNPADSGIADDEDERQRR